MFSLLLSLSALTAAVLACPDHDSSIHNAVLGKRETAVTDWAYEASYNWGMLNPNYTTCQTGTMQSPIELMLSQGLSQNHIPTFSYPPSIPGHLYNWGYGPAFTLNSTTITSNPSLTYDNTTVYLKGWHIHAPADHSVQGLRSKAELHLVHADSSGLEVAVVAMRIDPGNLPSPFLAQFHGQVPNWDSSESISMGMDVLAAVQEVALLGEFWTYRGSLTSPPCREGVRFFVARNVLFGDVEQVRGVLGVSTFSARVEQVVWEHGINV